jgi:adenylosuccinate synthase
MSKQRAYLIAGLAYGDEGKGATVDYLTRTKSAGLIVRYNGGPQAAHNVVLKDGRHHIFSQFGSGMFLPDVQTYLSKWMLVNLGNLVDEANKLKEVGITDSLERTWIDKDCTLITPFHVATNRLLAKNHNTCGQGVGQARNDWFHHGFRVLHAKYLFKDSTLRRKLKFIQNLAIEKVKKFVNGDQTLLSLIRQPETVDICFDLYKKWRELIQVSDKKKTSDLFRKNDSIIFEGAQGVLLDESFGDEDYNTWTDCTFNNVGKILRDKPGLEKIKIGVLRTYYTRHGDGPFPTEDPKLTYPEPYNNGDSYQGKFRLGFFDSILARKAISIIGGVDEIALNHLDIVPAIKSLGVPITITGWGPTAEDRNEVRRSS